MKLWLSPSIKLDILPTVMNSERHEFRVSELVMVRYIDIPDRVDINVASYRQLQYRKFRFFDFHKLTLSSLTKDMFS